MNATTDTLTDEQILMIGRRALDKCSGTEAQHLYIAREAVRAALAQQAATPTGPELLSDAVAEEIDELLGVIFQSARYERPSTDARPALEAFYRRHADLAEQAETLFGRMHARITELEAQIEQAATPAPAEPPTDGAVLRRIWDDAYDAAKAQRTAERVAPMLDDEGRAMVGASHHYTAENIRAIVERLRAFADPRRSTQAEWDALDWRGFCNVLWRIVAALAHEDPDPTLATEMALSELVDKIAPGLDSGDLLADAAEASRRLDAVAAQAADAANRKRMLCATGGLIAPQRMCASVIVGGRECGNPAGMCVHQREPEGGSGMSADLTVPPPLWALVEQYADLVHDYNQAVRIDVGIDKAGAACLAKEKELRAAIAQQAATDARGMNAIVLAASGPEFSFESVCKAVDSAMLAAPPATPAAQPADEREAFEAWLGRDAFTERSDTGKYVSAHVDAMWSAWQARAALEGQG